MNNTSNVAEMFDNISPHYDFLNHLLSFNIDRIWRKKTAKQASKNHPQHILDLATGTADLAILLAKRNPKASIVGVDISEKMLEIGQDKVRRQGLESQIQLQQSDAAHLPFADNSFDAITVAFGVRNFEDLQGSLNEMHRVLKAEGKIVILEFSMPSIFPFRQIYKYYFKHILPRIGGRISKNARAYAYLPNSVERFPSPDTFINIVKKTDFWGARKRTLALGIATLYSAIKS